MAAALTLTISVSIYAAEDDNQTIQSQTVDIEVDENGWRIYDKQDYTFPESFWGVPVTRIAEGACNNKFTGSAIHVTIPECITEIGEYAFANCDSELTLAWPANITRIPDHAFDTSYGLEEIQIPDTVTSIGTRAFYNCHSLTSIHLPDSLTEIKESAFEACSYISDITLPDSLQYIGDYAFNGALRNVSLKIPSTVKEIGKRAFYRSVTPAYGGYLSLIVEPGSYAYDYAKENALSMDLGETTILYTTCMNGDHDWRVIVDKEPTCTEDGQSHEQCYDCEIIKEDSDKVLPAKGHNWGYEYIRQATCTKDGYKSYECTNKGCTATKKDTLPATGHEWVLAYTIKYCEETGYNRYECSKCDAWEDKYEVPATGHKLEEYTEYESDSHKGTRYIYCVNCNYSRAEAVIYVD